MLVAWAQDAVGLWHEKSNSVLNLPDISAATGVVGDGHGVERGAAQDRGAAGARDLRRHGQYI